MSRSSSRPESVINSINDDANSREQSNEGLPSYEDVLREEEQGITYGNPSLSQSNNHLNVPRPPQRPPQKPPRPNTSSHSTLHQHHSHHTTSSNSTSRPRPPASSSSSPHQTKPSYRPPPPTQNPSTNSRIPWVYPSNFHCPKCNNTGYKLKNGKSCRSCWRRFAPTNQINYNPGPLSSVFVTPMGMEPLLHLNHNMAMVTDTHRNLHGIKGHWSSDPVIHVLVVSFVVNVEALDVLVSFWMTTFVLCATG